MRELLKSNLYVTFCFFKNEKETRKFESLIFASMIILQRLDEG